MFVRKNINKVYKHSLNGTLLDNLFLFYLRIIEDPSYLEFIDQYSFYDDDQYYMNSDEDSMSFDIPYKNNIKTQSK